MVPRARLLFVIDSREVMVIAATRLEANAVRRECPQLRVIECGIALVKSDGSQFGDVVISCGLAGGLSGELPTGTVLVPREIERPTGERVSCDRELHGALLGAARQLGF